MKTRIMIAIGGGLALAASGRLLWLMIEDRSWGWSFGAGFYVMLWIVTLIGMWRGPYQPNELPAQLIQPLNGQTHWLVDAAAAVRIKST